MGSRMLNCLRFAFLLLLGAGALAGPDLCAQEQSPEAAAERYRGGDYKSAKTLWQEAFQQAAPGPERGRLAYNLGNSAFRRNRFTEAVGWYSVGLRYLPRDGDLWANLELARAEADLSPADGGGLTDMLRTLADRFTGAESRWLALLGLAILALMLVGEALRGGSGWRLACLIALGLLPIFFAPWIRRGLEPAGAHLVLQEGAGGRSEPRTDAASVQRLKAGDVVSVFDDLPGWKRARLGEGAEVWVQEDALFQLDR